MVIVRRTAGLVLLLTALTFQLHADEDPEQDAVREEATSNVPDDETASALVNLADSLYSCFAPEPSEKYAGQAARHIHKREYDQGIEALSKAIAENPGDAGINYDPTSDRQLSAESLQHGRKQVERMLEDRPVMLNHIEKDGLLVRWASRKFAGEDLGQVIYWDPELPTGTEAYAQHTPPIAGQEAAIRVAKTHLSGPREGIDLTFEELWAAVIFELHNIANVTEFTRIHNDATAGKFTRDEYVAAMFRSEFKSMQRTRAFYCRVYLLWAREKDLRTEPALWYTQMWGGPDATLDKYSRSAEYPWAYYGNWFDKLAGRRQ